MYTCGAIVFLDLDLTDTITTHYFGLKLHEDIRLEEINRQDIKHIIGGCFQNNPVEKYKLSVVLDKDIYADALDLGQANAAFVSRPIDVGIALKYSDVELDKEQIVIHMQAAVDNFYGRIQKAHAI